MTDDRPKRVRVLISLLVASVQGAALYGLHRATDLKQWPATDLSWLAMCYAIATFAPLTLQLMGEFWHSRLLWRVIIGITALFGYFGWQYGSVFGPAVAQQVTANQAAGEHVLGFAVLWLLMISFLRCRLASGHWASSYQRLFSATWQNTLMLAEAAAFTGAFWLLLALWGQLFDMVGIKIFSALFQSPKFAYPFTTLAFGFGLYLTGSVERLVSVAREQILGLLKWLTPVAALILALFTPTLIFKLPGLVSEGERAISATWLLWLITLVVLLVNAGYQNGAVEKPYPARLQTLLRIVMPLLIVIAGTAIYALFVRVSKYGLSAQRVYALLVALIACIYAVGYTVAAVKSGPWLKGIEQVNIAAAITLMSILVMLNTPIASPYRLAAKSQLKRAIHSNRDGRRAALSYLRFDSGRYGRSALYAIVNGEAGANNKDLNEDAKRTLAAADKWDDVFKSTPREVMESLTVFPVGRTLDVDLAGKISEEIGQAVSHFGESRDPGKPAFAAFVDLDDDAIEECVVFAGTTVAFFEKKDQKWRLISQDYASSLDDEEHTRALKNALVAGQIHPVPRRMKDVQVGEQVFEPNLTIEQNNEP